MKIRFCKLTSLLILLLMTEIICQDSALISSHQDTTLPLIIEYIPQFKVTANDLKNAIKNQFSSITTGTVATAYVSIDQAVCNLTYKNGAVPDYQTPLKVNIKNDTYGANCSFKATVKHLINTKKYNCYAVTSDITVNYTKQVDFVSGNTFIKNFNTSYSPNTFKAGAICAEKESDKDRVRINQALSNSESQSVYLQLKKTLDKMKDVFQQNVETQHLSQLYPENPYVYDYYNYSLSINVSTVDAQKFKEEGVANKIKGTVSGASKFPTTSPNYEQGYSLFLAKEFIQNIMDYSLLNYKGWKDIKANKSNMRINAFKFRLIDYEYIVPELLRKFPEKYLADTEVSCSVLSYDKFVVVPGQMVKVEVRWSCLGSFQPVPGSRYNFINFQPTLSYDITFKVASGQPLAVYAKPTLLTNLAFNIIDGNLVEDVTLVKYAIDSALFEFQCFTLGSYMRIGQKSSQLKLTADGIWIG